MFSFFRHTPQPISPKVYAEGEFDIEGMPVFSVERDMRRGLTIICFTHGTRTEEWNLPVSPVKHDDLVRRFRAKIGQPSITSYNP